MYNKILVDYIDLATRSLKNSYSDNWDYHRFGDKKPPKSLSSLLRKYKKNLKFLLGRTLGRLDLSASNPQLHQRILESITNLEWVYDRLADNESRNTLLQILAYRSMGYRRIKMPLNNAEYWSTISKLEELADSSEEIDLGFSGFIAKKLDLSSIGYNIRLFYVPAAIIYVFILKQYCCKAGITVIAPTLGDTIIDAGGCFGDTALYFAHEAGKQGRVYSIEFMPANLAIFNRNMNLNPSLVDRITLISQPLWSKSGETLYVEGQGPGTRVVPKSNNVHAVMVETVAIDDLVQNERIGRVDFIKMDIEGAELESLKGAVKTICQYKPKLAISVYHKFEDTWEIPQYIDSLGLGYKFALRHFTIHAEETVLFAYIEDEVK